MKEKQKIAIWAFYNPEEAKDIQQGCDAMLKKTAELGGVVRLTSFQAGDSANKRSFGHNAWVWTYAEPDLIPWLFAHKRK